MKKNKKVLVIAEIGVNHNGKIQIAKKLIKKAVDAGADVVKFQFFKTEKLVTPYAKKADYQLKFDKKKNTQFEMLKKLELSFANFLTISKFCKKLKIEFCVSCFDSESLDLLKKIKVKRIKIPSGEITNYPLLKKIAQMKKMIIMSTGMSTLIEIKNGIEVLLKNGSRAKDITLLQCNSEYPSPYKDANLLAIKQLKNVFNTRVGYSDHTKGIEASIAAVALGASVIEKHITLKRSLKGPDHRTSIEPHEFKRLVNSIRNVEIALGKGKKIVTSIENKNKKIVRKSIVASKNILKGEKLSLENLDTKRPGNGMSPMLINKVIGKRANKNYKYNEAIKI